MDRGIAGALRGTIAQTSRGISTGALIAGLLIGAVAPAQADELYHNPVAGELAPASSEGPAVAPPEDDVRSAYLARLFDEVNERRERAHTPRFQLMIADGNNAVSEYLADLLPAMQSRRACFHGSDLYGLRAGWDYLVPLGIDTSKVGGEVLACPDSSGFWTPAKIADGWWRSPTHQQTLYKDARPSAVACGVEGPIRNGEAYTTVACITVIGDRNELIVHGDAYRP